VRPREPGKPKRQRRDDLYFARLAARYAELVELGMRRPIPLLAAETGLAPSTLTAAIRDARRTGFLTATPRGRAGGRLTAKARRLLDDDTKEE